MRKLLFSAVLALTLNACTKDGDLVEPIKEEIPNRLDANAKVDASGNLVGVVTKEQLEEDAVFGTAFKTNYKNYTPNKEITDDLKKALEGIDIRGYFGAWCPDSKREVPKFYKIMETINFTNFDMIAVDTSKKANGLEKNYDLKYVATFILIKEGKEIGRFVENVSVNKNNGGSLENDILIIAKGEDYKPGRK